MYATSKLLPIFLRILYMHITKNIKTLRTGQNGWYFVYAIFKRIVLNLDLDLDI